MLIHLLWTRHRTAAKLISQVVPISFVVPQIACSHKGVINSSHSPRLYRLEFEKAVK